ncbi:hypothetical protein LTR70_010026 [Exophiala xenobiotica]|uniref:Xylanolytic transcriptional activator regulatory domain-containing protein n=1 Tax=Lithohypha guttulata TaxID=1690604 RepID=A0ABR0JVN6_9EURO|nr:hypothetical protein LTR24_009992 [Lithohypha guttulata]KAK5309757.1 hypothetical protein LTR70_010026 [Exophiala xenobiotica]
MQSHQAESLDMSQRDMQGNLNRPDLDQHNTYMEDNYAHAHEADYHTSFPVTEGQISSAPTEDLGHYFDLSVFDSSTFRASKMDWLGCDTNFSDGQTSQSLDLHMHTPSTYGDLQQMHGETVPQDDFSHDVASCGPAQHTPLNIDRPTNQQPVASDNDNQATWPHVLDRGGNEMWPFDYASNRGFRRIKLPQLRQVLEDTVGHRPAIEMSTLKDLIKVLSAPQIPSFNDSPALEALPAVSFLTKLVKIYFAEFHPVLSVIHVPTWGIENCPTALLAAMASFGATYSTAEGSQEVAALLAEITQRALFWMGQANSTVYRNPAYIAAMCFHQIHSLGSGNRRLYELADASRGLLVTSLRGLSILSSDREAHNNNDDFLDLKRYTAAELEQAWIRWRDKEMEKRVAWAVFEFDCTLSTMTGKRGTFSIAELPAKLPCSESLCETHSAKAWASMISFATSPPDGVLFYPLLRDILAHKPIANSNPAWAKRD